MDDKTHFQINPARNRYLSHSDSAGNENVLHLGNIRQQKTRKLLLKLFFILIIPSLFLADIADARFGTTTVDGTGITAGQLYLHSGGYVRCCIYQLLWWWFERQPLKKLITLASFTMVSIVSMIAWQRDWTSSQFFTTEIHGLLISIEKKWNLKIS